MNLNNLVIMPEDKSTKDGMSHIEMTEDIQQNDMENEHPYGHFVNDIFYIMAKKNVEWQECQKRFIKDFYDILNNKRVYE